MNKKHILIVEDEVTLLKLETILLKVKGYDVTGAVSGKDALEKLSRENIDLVLLDIMLPDIDGFEVCTRIRKEVRTAAIPVIMLTARKSPGDLERGVASGADAYITKPFKSARIIEQIERLLNDGGASTQS